MNEGFVKLNPKRKFAAALFLFASLAVSSSATPTDWLANPWFQVGEKLTYHVYWGVIPVGSSVATTEWVEHEGRKLIAIRFRTKSNKVLRTIYPVDDLIETLIDPKTFLPVRFTKRLKEGRYRCDETTTFDFDKKVARWYSKKRDRTKEYPIKDNTRDIVSFMYFIRGQVKNFEKGKRTSFQVMADEKLYDLFVEPLREEQVKLPGYGKVKSMRFEPEAAFEGIFVRKGKITLWASNDERRILTRIQAKVPFASVKIVLVDVDGPGDDTWIKKGRKKKKRDASPASDVSSPDTVAAMVETDRVNKEEDDEDSQAQ